MRPIGTRPASGPTPLWRWRLMAAAALVFLLGTAPAWAITLKDVIALSRAGVSDEVLIELIDMDETVFHLAPSDLLELKAAGVSDRVVVVMLRTAQADRERRERAEAQARLDALRASDAASQSAATVVGDRAASGGPSQQVRSAEPAVVTVPVPVAVPVVVQQFVGSDRPRLRQPGSGGQLSGGIPLAGPATAADSLHRAGRGAAPEREKKAFWIVNTSGWVIK